MGSRRPPAFSSSSMDDFYRDFILDHYRNPRNFGHIESATITAEDLNPLCGDQIRVDLAVKDGIVQDVRWEGKGCAISQASASMLSEGIKGMKLEDVAKLSKDVVLENVGIGISPTRMKCAMLGLRVLKSAAIGEIAGWPDEE
jgi:nitrogen fixation protein NifU and related proteins